jgi:hypothetical protein
MPNRVPGWLWSEFGFSLGWGVPINLYTAVRIRHHVTTYRGLRDPCEALRSYCSDQRLVRSFHAGTSYLAVGTVDSAGGAAR